MTADGAGEATAGANDDGFPVPVPARSREYGYVAQTNMWRRADSTSVLGGICEVLRHISVRLQRAQELHDIRLSGPAPDAFARSASIERRQSPLLGCEIGLCIDVGVSSDTWPSQARIVLMSTPACNKCVAVECRITCGLIRLPRSCGAVARSLATWRWDRSIAPEYVA
jgi:hypothetical protein